MRQTKVSTEWGRDEGGGRRSCVHHIPLVQVTNRRGGRDASLRASLREGWSGAGTEICESWNRYKDKIWGGCGIVLLFFLSSLSPKFGQRRVPLHALYPCLSLLFLPVFGALEKSVALSRIWPHFVHACFVCCLQ